MTGDPGNAEADAEAIKVNYCRRSEACSAVLGSVSVAAARLGSVQHAAYSVPHATVLVLWHNLLLLLLGLLPNYAAERRLVFIHIFIMTPPRAFVLWQGNREGGGRGKSSVPQYEATSLTSWGNKKSATTIIKQATAGRADLGRTRGELISLHGRIFRLHMHVGHAACSMGHAACGCLSRVAHKCGSRHD